MGSVSWINQVTPTCNHRSPGERGDPGKPRKEAGDVMTEANVRVTEGKGQETRNAGSLQNPEEAGKHPSTQAPKAASPAHAVTLAR